MPVFINPITGQVSYVPLGAGYYIHPATHSADIIDQASSRRFVSDIQIAAWNSKAEGSHAHVNATPGNQGFMSGADKTKLDAISGANTGDETATTLGAKVNSATAKNTPVDADMIGIMDSAAGNILKKLSWTALKAALKTFFDDLYNNYTHPATHPASIIEEAIDKRFFLDAERTKLTGIEASANNYTHPTTDGNKHVPATSTTNNNKLLKAGATAGVFSWQTLVEADIPTLAATKITQTASYRFVSDTEKADWNRVKSKPYTVVTLIQFGVTQINVNNGFDFAILNFNNDPQGTSLQFENMQNGDCGTILIQNHNGAVVPLVFDEGLSYAVKYMQGYQQSVVANGISIIVWKYAVSTLHPNGIMCLSSGIYE